MKEYILYSLSTETIKSTIKVIDLGKNIKVDGYDRGSMVKGIYGGYGYEYAMTIAKDEIIDKLDINFTTFDELIIKLFTQFKDNPKCFSLIKKIFEDECITYEYFSWREGD